MDSLVQQLNNLRQLLELINLAIVAQESASSKLANIQEQKFDTYFNKMDKATLKEVADNALDNIDKLYDLHRTVLQILRYISNNLCGASMCEKRVLTTIATGEYTNPEYIKTNE